MKYIFYILFSLISVNGITQLSKEKQNQVDSLNAIINNKTSPDTIKALAYLDIVSYYYLENPDTAITLCKKSLRISEQINFLKGKSNSYGWLGYLIRQQGDIPQALEYYHKSIKIQEEIGDKHGMAICYNNIGYVLENQEDLPQALKYYHKSLKIKEEIGEKDGIANTYNNIGNIHFQQNDIAMAMEYYQKSLEIYEEIGDKYGIATSYNNIGRLIEDKQYNIPQALEYYQKSLKIRKEIGDKNGMAISYSNIGSLKLKTGALIESESYLSKGLKLSQKVGSPRWISHNSKELSRLFKQTNRYKQSLEMYELHIRMRDSIINEATQKSAIQQQAKFEYEKKQALKDKEHEKQLEVEKEAKAKQKVITYATAGGLGLLAIFLLFVMNRLKVTRKQKEVIEEQKQVVEEAHQEITDSITYAKRIQSAILPPAKLVAAYLKEHFILYKPKDVVAGDFYWMEHKDNKVLFAAADCTGHGVPGAMVSVVCNNALNRSIREHGLTDPGEILTKTRGIVIQEFEKSEEEVKDGMDIALCSIEGMKLLYAGANNPLWIIRNGEVIETKANKQPIGKYDNPEPYTTHSFELEKSDSIYIFSDGYVDQFGGEKGKKFKAKAFRELLLSIQNKPMDEQKTIIDETFEKWRGDLEQIDDVCVIGVRV